MLTRVSCVHRLFRVMAKEREVLGVPGLVVSKFAIETLNSPSEPRMDTQPYELP